MAVRSCTRSCSWRRVTQDCSLWVGSHNLTAMAVGGGNFEAGLMCTAPAYLPVMQDAIIAPWRRAGSLPNCSIRATWSVIGRFSGVIAQEPEWDTDEGVLVIHAEASQMPTQLPFIVHINVVPIELDRLFRLDRPVRLFLQRPGRCGSGLRSIIEEQRFGPGKITAVVRTERHPKNRGARGQFVAANYNIDIPNLACLPILTPSRQSPVLTKTQVVMRLDQLGEVCAELFSIAERSPVESGAGQRVHALELHQVDGELVRFFTPESVEGHMLVYRPVTGVQQNLVVTGYEETVRSRIPGQYEETVAPETEENAAADAKDETFRFQKTGR